MFIIKKLNISNFKTRNLKYIGNLFSQCSLLKEIDISNYITDNLKDMNHV